MESFIDFFEDLSALYKLGWIFACLAVVWVIEGVAPLVRFDYKKLRHIGTNFVFLSMSMLINLLVGIATVGVFFWIDNTSFGVLNWISVPFWVEVLIAVAALDFVAQYVAHYILHKVSWMWKFHMIHHSDTHVDATTGTRHHPGDYIIRETFAIATVVLFGIPVYLYVFYRICSIFFTYLTHANISLPLWLDKLISLVFISPNMHKFHHHFERPWTDTNFGNIFSIWDRLFGTLVYEDPAKIEYGLDVLDGSKDSNIGYQLQIPVDSRVKTDY